MPNIGSASDKANYASILFGRMHASPFRFCDFAVETDQKIFSEQRKHTAMDKIGMQSGNLLIHARRVASGQTP
jgi:hypothetical protein